MGVGLSIRRRGREGRVGRRGGWGCLTEEVVFSGNTKVVAGVV